MELTEFYLVFYISNYPPALTIPVAFLPSPTFLVKSWSYTHTIPGKPPASEYCDRCRSWASRQPSFVIFSASPVHAPVSEHPELEIPYMFFGKHVQQVR